MNGNHGRGSEQGSDALARTGRPPAYVGVRPQGQSLADVLERVLDKGIVIVGDIQVRLLDIELLTIKLRLMISSVERAREMGINWWEGDPFVSSLAAEDEDERRELEQRIDALEERLSEVAELPETKPETETEDAR
jgi:hypothetical protein